MSVALRTRSEIRKLAALLHVDDGDLGYLAAIPVADLRAFRQQLSDGLFDEHGDFLQRIARTTSIVPTSMAAGIAQKNFGPLLSARITAYLDPAKAVDLSGRLGAPFLAELAAELDPRHAADMLARMPLTTVAAVAAELERRRDFVTLGRFMGFVNPDALMSVVASLDDSTLLSCTSFAEPPERLSDVIASLSDERLVSIVRTATESDQTADLLTLADEVTSQQRARVVDVITRLDDELLSTMLEAADRDDLWDALVPIVSDMDADTRAVVRTRAEALGALGRMGRLADLLS